MSVKKCPKCGCGDLAEYLPTQQDILRETAIIRAGWSERTREHRTVQKCEPVDLGREVCRLVFSQDELQRRES